MKICVLFGSFNPQDDIAMEEDIYKDAPGLDPELEYVGIEELMEGKK